MVHDCRMHPDLQHAFLSNFCFPVPCFDENTTTEELCRSVQLDKVTASLSSAHFSQAAKQVHCQTNGGRNREKIYTIVTKVLHCDGAALRAGRRWRAWHGVHVWADRLG